MATDNELIKIAESIEALAKAISEDNNNANEKVASKRSSFEYGTLGDEYNPSGSDPLTRFALSSEY